MSKWNEEKVAKVASTQSRAERILNAALERKWGENVIFHIEEDSAYILRASDETRAIRYTMPPSLLDWIERVNNGEDAEGLTEEGLTFLLLAPPNPN